MASSALVSALLRKAIGMAGESGAAWLKQEQERALAAVLAGDEEITQISYEGGAASSRSRVSAQELIEATELALQELVDGEMSSGSMILPQFANIPR